MEKKKRQPRLGVPKLNLPSRVPDGASPPGTPKEIASQRGWLGGGQDPVLVTARERMLAPHSPHQHENALECARQWETWLEVTHCLSLGLQSRRQPEPHPSSMGRRVLRRRKGSPRMCSQSRCWP